MKMPYVLFGILVLVGMAISVYGLTVLYHARRSAGWPSTEGIITESAVAKGDESFSPTVAYSYAVDGKRYQGRNTAYGPVVASSTEAYAQAQVARYPVGTPVTVHYDPAKPAIAVLEPSMTKRSFIPLTFGLLFSTFGGWFWLLWWLCDE